ncbi:MAG: hypothetical protein BWZ09_02752 [Alphaproteobacteria bacterium ADurb.BinA305]|nr:MAG: hypothetical protein BWZ09_02752 [Alphaproteobacteria bacterium ADurb.BinA305]
MPQSFHRRVPSSRWKLSTERFPLMERSFFVRSATCPSASRKAAWSLFTFASFAFAR